MDTVWTRCTNEEINELLRDKTALKALERAEQREEEEWIQRMIYLYETTDRDALNEHFMSKGEWV